MIGKFAPPLFAEVIGIAVINQNTFVILRLWLIACIVKHHVVVVIKRISSIPTEDNH